MMSITIPFNPVLYLKLKYGQFKLNPKTAKAAEILNIIA